MWNFNSIHVAHPLAVNRLPPRGLRISQLNSWFGQRLNAGRKSWSFRDIVTRTPKFSTSTRESFTYDPLLWSSPILIDSNRQEHWLHSFLLARSHTLFGRTSDRSVGNIRICLLRFQTVFRLVSIRFYSVQHQFECSWFWRSSSSCRKPHESMVIARKIFKQVSCVCTECLLSSKQYVTLGNLWLELSQV